MAKVGIRKSYAAGALTDLTAIFGSIKTAIVDAGFHIITNVADEIEFMPAGTTPADDTDDDMPHFALTLNGTTQIVGHAIFGASRTDPAAMTSFATVLRASPQSMNFDTSTLVDVASEVMFACDGNAGWWWIALRKEAQDGIGGPMIFTLDDAYVGARSRRFVADNIQGHATRYGVLRHSGEFYVPYVMQKDGTTPGNILLYTWSPIGAGWNFNARQPGSALPKTMMPAYPMLDDGTSAVVLFNEFVDVMAGTDGFTHEEVPAAGWIAIVGSDSDNVAHQNPFIVRHPGAFTTL